MPDTVDHPPHYNKHPSGVECVDIVEHMLFNVGNAIKYLWRSDHKDDALEDLRKAAWYVQREIERLEKQAGISASSVEYVKTVEPENARCYIDEYFNDVEETEAIVFDGLDAAILGVAEQHAGVGPLVAYSMAGIIGCYESQGMSHEEAVDFFAYNCQCLGVGEGTPIIVRDV